MRYRLASLLRNLAAGARLALFLPVTRLAFRVDVVQAILLFAVLCAIDIAGDRLLYAGAVFTLQGAGSEFAGLAFLALAAAVVGLALRRVELALALVVTGLAALPAVALASYAVFVGAPHLAAPDAVLALAPYALLAWQTAIFVRVVALYVERAAWRRWAIAGAGGVVLALPIALASRLVDDVPWFRMPYTLGAAGELSAASEPVLATQRELLDDALASLDDRDPGGANVYFVVYAPDGEEAAWNDHVEEVRDLADAKLGTKGRSLVLRTHADTMLTTPFATVSNLREALAEISEAGDPEQDILMLYIGGRGTRGGVVPARLPPLNLVSLTPTGLRSLLDDAGFEWRVIIVASCYAGAYVDALGDDHTVVVAASAADKPSFGCEGRGDPTFFGNAFFDDGFAQGDSIAAAFAIARDRVAARESERGLSPSSPMLHVGERIAPMVRHLKHGGAGTMAAAGGWHIRPALWRPRAARDSVVRTHVAATGYGFDGARHPLRQ
ncbi:MAG: hypothetical protein JSR18_02590 [Proteobacteria bacterium]|nr:hypothetical protein [Pseudomonadota bacterium]